MTDADAIREADRRRRQAMIDGDLGTLASLLADGLVWTHSSGRRDGKAAFLERIAAGAADYLALEVGDDSVSVHGEVVLHWGDLTGRVLVDGQDRPLRNRFLAAWQRSGGGFELLAWQSTGF